jgi:short-subunit dehydrogenase
VCLRAELDAAGVRLTTICPGIIDTNFVQTTRIDAPAGRSEQVDERRGQLQKMFTRRRYGPDKVAKAIVSAVEKRKPIRPVALQAHVLYGLSRLLPRALRSTARVRVI